MNALERELNSTEHRARRREELRGVVAMAIPMVIATSTRMVMDVTDYLMISHLPEGKAQAALLPAQLFLWSYIIIGMGTVSIVATFVAQALGRQRHAECSAYAWQGLYLALAFGLVGLAFKPVLPWLVGAVGHEPIVQTLELAYCNVALWTIGPTIAAAALSAFFNGVHQPRVTMWSAIEGILVNLAVSFCLIFGKLGLPEMGYRRGGRRHRGCHLLPHRALGCDHVPAEIRRPVRRPAQLADRSGQDAQHPEIRLAPGRPVVQ